MRYQLNTTNYHDFAVLEQNRLPGRAYFIPYPDRASADAVSAKERRYKSEKVLCLNGDWDFKFYPRPAEMPEVLDTDSCEFDTLEVPSCWQFKGYAPPCYLNVRYPFPYNPPVIPTTDKVGPIFSWLGWDQGVHPRWKDPGEEYNFAGVYRKFIDIGDPDKRYVISFLGVASCLDLYCNGAFIGYGEGSHNTAEFDLTGKLTAGQNEIVAVVHRWCNGSYLECQDMFRNNGIFRDVLLRVSDPSDFRDLDMRTVRTGDSAQAGENGGTRGVYTLTLTARTYGDTEVTFTVEGHGIRETKTVRTEGGAASAVFSGLDVAEWNAEAPTLYRVYFETPTCCVRENLGFRTVEIRGDTFLINGRKAKIHGVNHHDTDPEKGYTMSPADIERDLLTCKKFNIDTIRTSHYPPDPLLLDLAEELGLYIIDEGDLETHGVCTNQFPPDFNSITDSPAWQERCLDRTVRQYERDKLRGNTAIILWSLGNESGGGCNTDAMYGWMKAHASVPVHYESVIHTPITCYDVGSEMYPPVAWVHDVGEKRRKQAKLNDRPYLMCEYAHAMGVGPGNIEAYWKEIYTHDNLMGGCIWEFADHAVTEPDGS
ncbi:MAG: hypothetical protein IJT94_14120, partial [Oscillibacter sp.]|nr:hypothetical protein [Oscillibacter sp.]